MTSNAETIGDLAPSLVARKIGTLQFSLRAVVIATTIGCVLLAYWAFFRPHVATVTYRFATLDAAVVKAALGDAKLTKVEGSIFKYLVLDAKTEDALLNSQSGKANFLGEKTRNVGHWPRTADTFGYSQPRKLLLDAESNHIHTDWESGGLSGFLGSRRAGPTTQLRIECDVNYERPDESTLPSFKYKHQHLEGKIFYEGETPDGKLMFLAPVDESSVHVVIFDVKK